MKKSLTTAIGLIFYLCFIFTTVSASGSTVTTYSKASNGNTYLSTNFKVSEFACKDGSDTVKIDSELVMILQKIRDHFGKAIVINSGYRTSSYNAQVGGASNSYHVKGMAADISVSGVTPSEVAKYAETIGVRGVGKYKTFVHVDTRPTKYYWTNSGNGNVTASTHGGNYNSDPYGVPEYEPQGHNPEGCIDSVTGDVGSINVRGWAFDWDDTSVSIPVHVYIGGPVGGNNVEGYPITADVVREDVNAVYGVGDYHGFSSNIKTSKTGQQDVYIYACNVGGGTNILLGVETVNILPADTTIPAISDVKITNLSDNGYTVSCTVTDESGISVVRFPSWTAKDGQDDLIWKEGTRSGNTFTVDIPISEHNNEHGPYITHIYADDNNGNSGYFNAGVIILPSYHYPVITEKISKDKKYLLINNVDELNWSYAEKYCLSIGGHLVSITSEEEQKIVEEVIEKDISSRTGYYIGCTDSEVEGVWEWIDGEPWGYTNWDTGEPNNAAYDGTEDFGEIYKSNFKWNDMSVEYVDHNFICEINLPKYTISYKLNGGDGNDIDETFDNTVSANITSYIPQKDGYEFLGWATSATAQYPEYISGDIYDSRSNLTLYAVWKIKPCTSTQITKKSNYTLFDIGVSNAPVGCSVILALYNDGMIADVQMEEYVGENCSFASFENYTTAKIMLWDGIDTMKPLSEVEVR